MNNVSIVYTNLSPNEYKIDEIVLTHNSLSYLTLNSIKYYFMSIGSNIYEICQTLNEEFIKIKQNIYDISS